MREDRTWNLFGGIGFLEVDLPPNAKKRFEKKKKKYSSNTTPFEHHLVYSSIWAISQEIKVEWGQLRYMNR
jgi:hypothetical protein